MYKKIYDENREKDLKKLGITIERFEGHYVLKNTNDALQTIIEWINKFQKTHP